MKTIAKFVLSVAAITLAAAPFLMAGPPTQYTPSYGILAADPAGACTNGSHYYNSVSGLERCCVATVWSSCSDPTLSHLTSPTAVNQDLLPGVTNTVKLGNASKTWLEASVSGLQDYGSATIATSLSVGTTATVPRVALNGDGSAALPAMYFVGDTTMGLYHSGTNAWTLSAAGLPFWTWDYANSALLPGRANTFTVSSAPHVGITATANYDVAQSTTVGNRTVWAVTNNGSQADIYACAGSSSGSPSACETTPTTASVAIYAGSRVAIFTAADGIPILLYKSAVNTLSAQKCATSVCAAMSGVAQTISSAWSASRIGAAMAADGSIAIFGGTPGSTAVQYIQCINPVGNCSSVGTLRSITTGMGANIRPNDNYIPVVVSSTSRPVMMVINMNYSGGYGFETGSDMDGATWTETSVTPAQFLNDRQAPTMTVGPDGSIYYGMHHQDSKFYIWNAGVAATSAPSAAYSAAWLQTGSAKIVPSFRSVTTGRMVFLSICITGGQPQIILYECSNNICTTVAASTLLGANPPTTQYLGGGAPLGYAIHPQSDGNIVIPLSSSAGTYYTLSSSVGTPTATGIGIGSLALPLGPIVAGGDISGRNITASSTLTGNVVDVGAAGMLTGEVRLNGSTTGTVTLKSAATTASYDLVPPPTVGAAGQAWAVQGVGSYAWTTVSDDIQVFTTTGSNTWTKPTGAKTVEVILVSGGAGGASGRKGANGSDRCGGGGGAGGGMHHVILQASILSATETVYVGAAGTGGAAQATNSTDGVDGTNGGPSYFGPLSSPRAWAAAGAPGKGTGGTATGGAGGSGGAARDKGGNGGSSAPGASTAGVTVFSQQGTGGGSGGDITAAGPNTVYQGMHGGDQLDNFGGVGGLVGGAAPVAGTGYGANVPLGGTGGGGGAASTAGAAQAGASGGGYGGGGGGGGAGTDGVGNSGAGGAGAQGIVVVITRF